MLIKLQLNVVQSNFPWLTLLAVLVELAQNRSRKQLQLQTGTGFHLKKHKSLVTEISSHFQGIDLIPLPRLTFPGKFCLSRHFFSHKMSKYQLYINVILNPVIIGQLPKSPNLYQTKVFDFMNISLLNRIWYNCSKSKPNICL